jgi:hypothetical protein
MAIRTASSSGSEFCKPDICMARWDSISAMTFMRMPVLLHVNCQRRGPGWWYKLRVLLEPDAHVAELVRPGRASETDLFRSIDGVELIGGSGRTEMGVDMLARADNVLARTVVQSFCSAPPKPDAESNVP